MRKSFDIGNYTTVSEILAILEANNCPPEHAEIEVDTFTDSNSCGHSFASSQVWLHLDIPTEKA